MKYLYFAYGSNLNVEQMKRRCPNATEISSAVLDGYQVVLKAKEIYNGME